MRRIRDAARGMSPPRYTVSDAAEMVQRSPDTLERWRKSGVFVPSETHMFGSMKVYLYTHDDIVALRKVAAKRKRGPAPDPFSRRSMQNNSNLNTRKKRRREATKIGKRIRKTKGGAAQAAYTTGDDTGAA